MDNNIKIQNVLTTQGDPQKAASKKLEQKTSDIKESFGNVSDIRLLSAEFNKSSADFKGFMSMHADKEVNKVISSFDQIQKPDDLVGSYPSEEILALTKLMSGKK